MNRLIIIITVQYSPCQVSYELKMPSSSVTYFMIPTWNNNKLITIALKIKQKFCYIHCIISLVSTQKNKANFHMVGYTM